MSNEELWQAVLGEIELSISKANFVTWFKKTAILSRADGRVVVGVPNGFAKEWLENKYNHALLQALKRFDSTIAELTCTLTQSLPPSSSDSASPRSVDAVQARLGGSRSQSGPGPLSQTSAPMTRPVPLSQFSSEANLNPRYTFENFIVGENNELARAACYAASQNLGILYNPLFIYGGVGLGKTHLLQSIGNEVLSHHSEKNIRYVTTERFTSELIEAIKSQKMNDFKEHYQRIDLLIIDDVQFLSGREKTQNEFFHIFNVLYQLNKQIVISSDRPPKAIPTIEDRLRSRFEGGMIADISRPDLETRIAILRSKMTERGFFLDDECARFIAENITNNIRELEGALNRVMAACEFHKIIPTVSYIKKILGQVIVNNQKTLTFEGILKVVGEFYGTPAEELLKKGRKKKVVHPRQVAMYLMRFEMEASFASIGKSCGGRDHTTVLHACEKITREMEENMHLKEEINNLKERLYRE